MANIDVYEEIYKVCKNVNAIVNSKNTRIDAKLEAYDKAIHSIAGISLGAINQLKLLKKE